MERAGLPTGRGWVKAKKPTLGWVLLGLWEGLGLGGSTEVTMETALGLSRPYHLPLASGPGWICHPQLSQ